MKIKHIQTQQVLTFGTQQEITLAELYEQLGANHSIDGDSVFIDDSNLYMSATPHTLYSSGSVEFKLISKVYEGSADIIFGFDYPTTKPTSAEYYNPTVVTTEESYTCSEPYWYSYTTNPKVFNCWKNTTSNTTGEVTSELIFTHAFDRADIPTRTAYWNVQTTKNWHDIAGSFQSVNYEYEGMNKWYYKTFDVVKDQEYTMKANIDIPFKDAGARKYWVCIKPSSETISQAVANNHLYCLDPWYDSSWGYKKPLYFGNNVSSDITTSGIQSFDSAGNFFYVSCNADGTILKTDDTSIYSETSILETQIFNFGDIEMDKRLDRVKVSFRRLATGESITVKYKIDGALTWTTIGTFNTANSISKTFTREETNDKDFTTGKEFQFRFEVTGGMELTGYTLTATELATI
jgi:hypothetical protein